MSDFNPIDQLKKRSNSQHNEIMKYVSGLDKHIGTIAEGKSITYLQQYKFILESLADYIR
jgi:hypothetical protein